MYKIIKEFKPEELRLEDACYELEGLGVVTLTRWNGETYCGCYRSDQWTYPLDESESDFELTPVYKEIDEDQFELIGFED